MEEAQQLRCYLYAFQRRAGLKLVYELVSNIGFDTVEEARKNGQEMLRDKYNPYVHIVFQQPSPPPPLLLMEV